VAEHPKPTAAERKTKWLALNEFETEDGLLYKKPSVAQIQAQLLMFIVTVWQTVLLVAVHACVLNLLVLHIAIPSSVLVFVTTRILQRQDWSQRN